jgi:dihydropyrimidinase
MSGMGLMNADTFESATRSAAMGGTTSVISFAAQARGQTLRATVDDYAARARRGAMVDHAFHVTVTDPAVPGFDTDFAALAAEGHRSFKVFTTYAIKLEDAAILRVMAAGPRAWRDGLRACRNRCPGPMPRQALLAAGQTAPHHHALSHPRLAEIEAVERICRFAEFLDQPVMLFHISTAEGVDAVRAARARGVPPSGPKPARITC